MSSDGSSHISVGKATGAGSDDINGVLWGYKWTLTTLTYSFPTSAQEYLDDGYDAVNGFAAFNTAQETAVKRMLDNVSAVTNLEFQRTTATSANLRFAMADSIDTGPTDSPHLLGGQGSAEANPPDPNEFPTYSFGDAFFNKTSYNNPVAGSAVYAAGIMHEIGHALGLKHGFSAQTHHGEQFPALSSDHDSQEYTVMTYRRYPGSPETGLATDQDLPQTLMQNDIAALQYLYGADFTTNSGDSVYTWSATTGRMSINGTAQGDMDPLRNRIFQTVWDGGGKDTYDFSNYDQVLVVDLRPGAWTQIGGTGTGSQRAYLGNDNGTANYARGNIANALLYEGDTRSLIENVVGAGKADSITGNQASNTLEGNGDNDTLRGGLGGDVLDGGAGDDTLYGYDSNFIRNGSFETVANPTFDANGYGYNDPIEGWTLTAGSRLELFKSGVAGTPSDGRYGVDLEGSQLNTNVEISQVVEGLTDGAGYRIAFDIRAVSGANAQLEVYWGGRKLGLNAAGDTVLNAGATPGTYYIFVYGGEGTGADKNRLTFKEVGGSDTNGTLLDNVRMYRDGGTAEANDPALDGNDAFRPGTGSDLVYGHGGDDTVGFSDIGPGTDEFDGGSGTDTLVMDWSNSTTQIIYRGLATAGTPQLSPHIGQAESYTRSGAAFGEADQKLFFKEVEKFFLRGGTGNDTLKGGEFRDFLFGNGGDDTLNGGGGGDEINGGAGFDRAVIKLSGNGANAIVLKQLQNGQTVTLSDGTKLTSIEALDLEVGNGDDFLDVRGTVENAPGIASTDPNFQRTSTRFSGEGGNDTLAVDLATSWDATFDGGDGSGDLLIMDWSRATQDIFRDSGDGKYKSYSHTINVVTGGQTYTTQYFYTTGFTNVERFDLTGGKGNDTLYGASGDDRITTIGGRDTATLGNGNDTLALDWSGVDYNVVTSAFAVTSNASGYTSSYYKDPYDDGHHVDFSGADRFELKTGSGADRMRTGDGDDAVTTNGGNDWLATGKGADTVDGGAGGMDAWSADKLDMTTAMVLDLNLTGVQGTYVVGGKTATLSGIDALGYFGSSLTSAERFKTGSGNDVIKTSRADGYDYLETGAGNDKVTIYDGRDEIDTGTDVDTLVIDWSVLDYDYSIFTADFVGGLTSGYSGTYYKDPYDDANRVAFKGVEHFDITTDDGGDRITTGDGNDTVKTNGGNDWLNTARGADTVEGGMGGLDAWSADKTALGVGLTLRLNSTDEQGRYTSGLVTATVKGIDALGYRDVAGTTYQFKTGSGNDDIETSKLDGYDYLDTGAGTDKVTIYDGRDEIAMGAGTDTLVIDWSVLDYDYSIFTYNLTGSLAAGYSGVFYKDPYDDGNRVAFSGVEHFVITTDDGADRVGTGEGDDTVKTAGGDDWLNTAKGADTVDGGAAGKDVWSADKSVLTVGLTLDLNSADVQGSYTIGGKTATIAGIDALGYRDGSSTTLFKTGSGGDVIKTSRIDGNDYLDTGSGNDTVTIYDGRDEIDMGVGSDTLVVDWSTLDYDYSIFTYNFTGSLAAGYSGIYYKDPYDDLNRVIFSGVEQFDVTTGNANDRITTGDGDDKLTSNAGNDTLFTGLGADVVNGGAGDADRWQADKANATAGFTIDLTLGGVQGTYQVGGKTGSAAGIEALGNLKTDVNPALIEYFVTSNFDDVIVTRNANFADYIKTNGGADRVTVAGGQDVVALGGQNASTTDTLVVNWGTVDYAIYTSSFNAATAEGHSGIYYKNPYDDANRVEFTGVERFELTSGSAGDWLFTGDGNDAVTTNAGNDWMNTGKGADTVDGGAGGVDAWAADKAVMTAALTLDLNATAVQGTYTVGAASATVRGIDALGYRDGNTTTVFKAGSGNDVINTSKLDANDYLETGAGNDVVTVFDGRDEIAMGVGTDTLVVDWSVLDADYSIFTSGPTGNLTDGYSGVLYKDPYDDGNRVAFSGVEHFVVTTAGGADRIATGDGNDTVATNGGDDDILSGKGGDTIDGGAGVDTWSANKSDLTTALSLDLTLTGTQGTYTLGGKTATVRNIEDLGNGTADPFQAGSGNDVIVTRSDYYADQIATNGGADTVTVAGGRDWVDLGANAAGTTDTLIVNYAAVTNAVRTAGGAPTLAATGYSGTFFKDPYDDGSRVEFKGVERFEVTTGSAEDWITTGNGADVLNGGGGNDILTGAGGSDTYVVDTQADRVIEAVGSGVDTVKTSVSYVLESNQEIEVLATTLDTGTVAINLTGNERANTLRGNAAANILDGGLGADTMYGLAGNDTFLADNAGDKVYEAAGGGTLDAVKVATGVASYALIAGQQIEQLVAADVTGTAALSLVGNEFAQTIVGNAGANVLKGGLGADTLNGGAGIDTADFSDKTATVSVTVSGGTAATVTVGGVAEDRLYNIENVTGGTAGDALTGDGLANLLNGGGGADTLKGMAGNDTYLVDNAGDQVTEAVGGGADTVRTSVSYTLATGQEIELLATTSDIGTAIIHLTGNERVNTLRGNAAANILDGGLGADVLYGLAGNDTFLVNESGDKVYEAAGGGTLDTVKVAASAVSYALIAGQQIEQLVAADAAGTATLNLTGNELAQTITGNAGANLIKGGLGADTLNGGAGIDTADCSDKTTAVAVTLNGATAATVTVGGAAEDKLSNIENVTGGADADALTGDGLANVLNGWTGADTLKGMAGNDTYFVDNAGDQVIEATGGGTDTVKAGTSYVLAASQEIENLFTTNDSGTGAINLTGNQFGQAITGNAGANVLTGGAGLDRLSGGLGQDVFDFNVATETGATATTRDVILDFKQGDDRIDLSTIDANGTAAGDAFTFLTQANAAFTGVKGQLAYTREDLSGTASDRTIVRGDIDGNKVADFEIELKGLYTLTGGDFVL